MAKTSNDVKNRWITNNYKRYGVSLRYDMDQDIIDYLESRRKRVGKGITKQYRKKRAEKALKHQTYIHIHAEQLTNKG